MKHSSIIIAIAIILAVYTALNFYCIRRSAQALSGLGAIQTACVMTLICLACALPAGRIALLVVRNPITQVLVVAGSLYLGLLFYMTLITALADCIRLCDRLFHVLPAAFRNNPYPLLRAAWFTLAGGLCAVLFVGNFLSTHPNVRSYDMTINKKSGSLSEMTIAAISDIHFGTVVDARQVERIVRRVGQVKPDLVLLVGDIFDEDVDDAQRQSLIGLLRQLSCPLGVYAVTGNHDYYSGLAKALATLQEAGVIVLQDSATIIAQSFLLVGRKDLTAVRMGGGRKSLHELLESTDRKLPCILMDHQPFHLEEAETNGVDVQLSGHTHHGQLFPLNLMYRWIYERSWGYIQKGKTRIIVSCGAGTWGPPVRTNSRAEVLKITILFDGAED